MLRQIIRKIFERTGVLLTHDEITYLCENLWNCSGADDFYARMDSMTVEELREWARKAKKRRGGLLQSEELLHSSMYA